MSIKVGYLGPDTAKGPDKNTFGYAAAQQYFAGRDDIEFLNFRSHEAICEAFTQKKIHYGVVAIENVVGGVVAESVRAIKDSRGRSNVCICGEVVLPIELYCLRKAGEHDSRAKTVLSHPMALAQCDYFVQTLRSEGLQVLPTDSTGDAAHRASENPDYLAIASVFAEKEYGLHREDPRNVVDNKKSMTRFWILGKDAADKTTRDKTTFLINLKQESAGALWRALGCFMAEEADNGLFHMKGDDKRPNLLIVYPVPIDGKRWEYEFLLEFSGHISDPAIQEGERALANSGLSWGPPMFLGSYPDQTHAFMIS